jgi:protein O-GlcNAc transferase
VLLHRNCAQFEIYCYSDGRRVDPLAEKFEATADVWRKTLGKSDDQLVAQVQEDRIDILIDLTLHTRENRLMVFARKPAPVQATYLAYCGTSGVEAIDYRITDPYLDEPGADDSIYAEKSVRLPHTYWCYQPMDEAGAVESSPVERFDSITFGCLNGFWKVNAGALAAWGAILSRVPGSRLLLHCREGSHRHRVTEELIKAGVDPHRVQFVARVSGADYFKLYDQIDIGLDPFPYPGGTTTCDAMWMGAPVISLKGRTAVSRGGFSILSNVGLSELVANTVEEYVELAVGLAADRPRLIALRGSLRSRMLGSPLMDAPGFTRDFEAALRGMWRKWCAAAPNK